MQIGPRIRIGGTIGHVGQEIKDHVLPSPASMIGGAIAPIGALVGSALNGSVGSDLGKGIQNTGLVLAGKSLAGGGGDAGAAGGAGGDVAGAGSDASAGGDGGFWNSLLDDAKKYGGDVLGFLNAHKGDLVAAANVANSAYRTQQANNYAKQALSLAQDSYNQRAPLRQNGVAGLLAPTGNPFSTHQFAAGLPLASAPTPPATPGQPPVGGRLAGMLPLARG